MMKLTKMIGIPISILFLQSIFWSCSDANFAGGNGSAAAVQKPRPKKDGSTTTGNNPGTNVLTSDDGGNIGDCAKGTMIEDPTATYNFANDEERTFTNSLGKYTNIPTQWINAGNIHADQASANTVCKLKGYNAAISFSSHAWYSCGDNTHAYWNDSIKNFVLKNGCDDNKGLKFTACKGKLYDKCDKDKTWIFKKD
jgi:hypothetical protein